MAIPRFTNAIPELKQLARLTPKKRKQFLKLCSENCIKSLGDLGYNVLRGHVKLPPKKLVKVRKHKKSLVSFVTTKGNGRKRKIAVRNGGFIASTCI